MSRNVQRRSTVTPAQKTVQKSSIPTDDSSDDGYDGVDQISDSEEDEPDVEAAEEDVIRAFEDEGVTPRPESDDESVMDLPSPSFFNEHVEAIEPNYSSSSSITAGSPDRRVHFDLSDDDSESGDDKEYPDIFFDLDSLGPHFRQMIDEDVDNEVTSNNDGWWPSEESEEDAADEADDAEAMDSDSSDSSGYLTDEGETTDEDIPTTVHAPTRSVLRRISDASSSDDEAPTRRPIQKKIPKLSPFIHDGRKRYAMLDSTGKKMIMFGPNRRYSADGTTKRPQLQQMNYQMPLDSSPMISNSGNLMMTAMSYSQDFSLFGDFGGQAMGPSEAFFPFNATNAQDNSSVEYDEDESDPEAKLNLDTFFDFGETDDDNEADDIAHSPIGQNTPAQATRLRSEDQVHPLLHLNSGVVGQFREKHTHKNVKKRNQVSTAALAFEGPYNQGPIQGLKPNRIRHANEPITPMPRKLKAAHILGSSPGSPLANVSQANKKRKFNGQEFHGHKRNKSLI